jgi:hypothetical protein
MKSVFIGERGLLATSLFSHLSKSKRLREAIGQAAI